MGAGNGERGRMRMKERVSLLKLRRQGKAKLETERTPSLKPHRRRFASDRLIVAMSRATVSETQTPQARSK